MNTKASLEITKGGSLVEPVPGYITPLDDSDHDEATDLLRPFPSEEEWATLPRVAGTIPWTAWTVAFVEFVERFSYYGTSAVCECAVHLARLSRAAPLTTFPNSRELYPVGPASGLNHRRWLPRVAGLWGSGHGPACFNRNDDL